MLSHRPKGWLLLAGVAVVGAATGSLVRSRAWCSPCSGCSAHAGVRWSTVGPRSDRRYRTRFSAVGYNVTRDVDDRVDEVVRAGGFVLLSGESTAGKTRVADEAMRRVLPDHHLVAPASREAVRTVVETVVDQRRCVVWLDDVERFFGAHGLTVPLLDRMLTADAVVIGTIRVSELDRFGPTRDRQRRSGRLARRSRSVGPRRRDPTAAPLERPGAGPGQ